MGAISSRIHPECILMDPQSDDKEGIIRCLVDCLSRQHAIENPQQLIRDVLKREELISTCIGLGCAVPHSNSSATENTIFAAARLNPPRNFDAIDGEPVSLVFLMAGPEKDTGLHMRLLSKLARLLHDVNFREMLRNAENAEDFYRILGQKDI